MIFHEPMQSQDGPVSQQASWITYQFEQQCYGEHKRLQEIYQHVQLRDDEIRVLVLEPADDLDDDLQCHLQTIELSNSAGQEYEALSYHLGSRARTHTAYIDGHECSVTGGAYDALRHLRHPSKRRSIWIDAICINQQDLDERNKQVAMMREIYTGASRVVVWLGRLDDRSQTAIKALREMGADRTVHLSSRNERHASIDGLTFETEDLRSNMIDFFHIPWFRRVWTAQEILVARDTIFLCGDESFELSLLSRFIDNNTRHWLCCREVALVDIMRGIQTKSHSLLDEITLLIMTLGLKGRPFQVGSDDSHDNRIGKEDFLSLLAAFRHRQASDPRDKIYGMLGLARPEMQTALAPDYRLSAAQVFTDAAIAIIKESGDLKLLSHTYGSRQLDLPSWVPDWTARVDDLMMHQVQYQNLGNFKAGGKWREPPVVNHDGALVVEGAIVDDVVAVGPAAHVVSNEELLSSAQSLAGLHDREDKIAEHDPEVWRPPNLEQTFWTAFLGDHKPFDSDEIFADRPTALPDWTNVTTPSPNVHHADLVRAWHPHFLNDDFSTARAGVMFLQTMFWARCAERRFVRTRKGCFGFAPAGAGRVMCWV